MAKEITRPNTIVNISTSKALDLAILQRRCSFADRAYFFLLGKGKSDDVRYAAHALWADVYNDLKLRTEHD